MSKRKEAKKKISKAEKIALGYEKRWKIILPCILIAIFIIMSAFTYIMRRAAPKAIQVRQSESPQRAVYNRG